MGWWQPGQVSCKAGKGKCWGPPLPTGPGNSSLFIVSRPVVDEPLLMDSGSRRGLVCPESFMKDGCFVLVMSGCTGQWAWLGRTAGEMVTG